MQSEDLTDEEKRVANLTKRWDATHNKIGILVTIIAIAAPLIGFRLHHIFGLLTLCCLIGFLTCRLVIQYFLHRSQTFLLRLTPEELEVVQSVAESAASRQPEIQKQAVSLLKAYHGAMEDAKKELLRSSTSSHDGMLLRPTTENHETPKEELLRAIRDVNNERQ